MSEDFRRPAYLWLSAIALLAAAGFGLSIVLLGPGSPWLHETAGIVLLVLIGGSLWAALGDRSIAPGCVPRAAVALSILVAMGSAGAALGLGALPARDAAIPGVLLVLLIVLLAEMVRFSWPRRGAPHEG